MKELRAAAEKVLKWVESAMIYDGGIAAWHDPKGSWGPVYPEVTGYLIPTLCEWGREGLAKKATNFLRGVQNEDGSFNGLDGLPRAFDTAACMEGLAYFDGEAARRAEGWIKRWCVSPEGHLVVGPGSAVAPIYLARVAWLTGRETHYWARDLEDWIAPRRSHYIAYCLEGMWFGSNRSEAEETLTFVPEEYPLHFWYGPGWEPHDDHEGDIRDLCATAQFAHLFAVSGMRDPLPLLESILPHQKTDGGLPLRRKTSASISWVAKWFLDAVHEVLT